MFVRKSLMQTRNFCTLFDSNYLLKGVAMIRSLHRFCDHSVVYVLCMDNETKRILELLNFAFVKCIVFSDIEDDELLIAKKNRGTAEYCWTLSSCFTWYVINTYSDIDLITYLDADIYFYSDVEPLFEEIGAASIAIIEHRFTERLKSREVNGRFCVEWNSFRKDEQGINCLSLWREQCIEWCYYRLEDGKMGDQKYLDEWPEKYSSCHILNHAGAGIAPWNYSQYEFSQDRDGNITVNGESLIFYHFHQFQLLDNGKFDRLSSFYTSECPEPSLVYERYEVELLECLTHIRSFVPDFNLGLKPVARVRGRRFIQKFFPMWLKEIIRGFMRY